MGCNHCEEFSRSHLIRQAVAEAGQRACRRSSRGCRRPPAPGLSRRSFLLRSERRDALRLRRLEAAARRPRGGDRPGGRRQRPRARLDLPRRRHRLALGARADHRPDLPLAAPDAGAAGGRRDARSPRTRACAGTRRLRRFDALHRAGKMSVLPGVGYTSPDQSHFTSRHYWEVGGLQPNEVTGWMGRLIDVIGTPDNPLQGLSLDGSLSPALATARYPVAAIDGPSYDLWAEGVWGEPEELMFGAVGELGRAGARAKDIGLKAAGAAAAQAMQLKAQLEPFSGEEIAPPVAYPEGDGRVVRREPRRARGDARRRPADPLRRGLGAGRIRHPRQPGGELRRRPQARRRLDRRLPGGPRGARARRPRDHPGLVGVRPPPRGERLRHRPRRRRARAS